MFRHLPVFTQLGVVREVGLKLKSGDFLMTEGATLAHGNAAGKGAKSLTTFTVSANREFCTSSGKENVGPCRCR